MDTHQSEAAPTHLRIKYRGPVRRFRDFFRPEEVTVEALGPGLTRYPRAVFWALLGSWSLLALAIWIGVAAALVGAAIGLFGWENTVDSSLGNTDFAGVGSAVGVVGALLGAVAGFGVGFALIMGTSILTGVTRIVVSMACGAALAAAATACLILIEPWTMYLRGYRPPSDREKLTLQPVLNQVAGTLNLGTKVPQMLIADTLTVDAWTHTRHVVLSKPTLQLSPDQLGGVLAHELTHWRSGDQVGLLFVSTCGLPLTLTITFLTFLRRWNYEWVGALATLVVWPFLVITKLMVGPALARDGRTYEFAADRAAVQAGFGEGLRAVLELQAPYEPARSGWQHVLYATHPPVEYRLEAIDDELKRAQGAPPQPTPAYRRSAWQHAHYGVPSDRRPTRPPPEDVVMDWPEQYGRRRTPPRRRLPPPPRGSSQS